jgi:hypothetical protein
MGDNYVDKHRYLLGLKFLMVAYLKLKFQLEVGEQE